MNQRVPGGSIIVSVRVITADQIMNDRPYGKLVEILRFTLQRLEKDATAYPDDAQMDELKRSLVRRLAALERNLHGSESEND